MPVKSGIFDMYSIIPATRVTQTQTPKPLKNNNHDEMCLIICLPMCSKSKAIERSQSQAEMAKEGLSSIAHTVAQPLHRIRRGMRCFVGVIMLTLRGLLDLPHWAQWA